MLYELREGKFSNQEILPKEEELAQYLKVSRTALRDVLKILEQEGYIIRIKKKGTIINKKILQLNFRIDIEYEFKDLLEIAGYKHSFTTIEIKNIDMDKNLEEKLDLAPRTPLVMVKKIIFANDKPVIICEDYFNLDLFKIKEPTKKEYEKKNIFTILEKYSGERLDFCITTLIPILPNKETKKLFKTQDPILMIEEVGFNTHIKPILFSKISWKSEFFNFHIFRKRHL